MGKLEMHVRMYQIQMKYIDLENWSFQQQTHLGETDRLIDSRMNLGLVVEDLIASCCDRVRAEIQLSSLDFLKKTLEAAVHLSSTKLGN